MSRRRILQVNELIKRELGKIIFREINLPKETLTTITRINTSNNLAQAKVYISVIPKEKNKEVFSILNKRVFDIQQELNSRLRMRPVPKIIFKEEKETEKAQEVEKLLEEIKKN